MSLEYIIEPKLAEIRRFAAQRWADSLRGRGLYFNEKGAIDFEPGTTSTFGGPVDLGDEEKMWADHQGQIDYLDSRFRKFYPITWRWIDAVTQALGMGHAGGVVADDTGSSSAYGCLGCANEWAQPVAELISKGHWAGTAADAFREGFLRDFPEAVFLQRCYLRELGIAARSVGDAAAGVWEDLTRIADACIMRLSGGDHGSADMSGVYTTVGIISSVVGFIPPLSVPANVVGLASGLASAFDKEAPKEEKAPRALGIRGGNGPLIIESTLAAIDGLEGLIADVDKSMGEALAADLASSDSFGHAGLRLERPRLADERIEASALSGGSWSNPSNPLVVSLVDLYRAGRVDLQGAADEYGLARAHVDSCVLPETLREFFPRSVPQFEEARSQLATIFRETQQNIADTALSLIHTAETYELTDAEQAEFLRQAAGIQAPDVRSTEVRQDPRGPV